MKRIDNQLRVLIDVDATLVRGPRDGDLDIFYANYYGMETPQVPINSNIKLLIAYKARGFEITVHSANGVEWAEEIIGKLKLEKYVDWVATKPTSYVDDRDANDWMQRVFVDE
jgi:phosphoglycolate phosphatase-like HAD superfamily hydrolase